MLVHYPNTDIIGDKPFFSDLWADIAKRCNDYHLLLTSTLYDRLMRNKIKGFSAHKGNNMLFFSVSLKESNAVQCTYFDIKNGKLEPYMDAQMYSLEEVDSAIPDGSTIKTY